MKTHILLPLTAAFSVVAIAFNLSGAESEAKPVLVFKWFAGSPTNAAQLARFELRNTTSNVLWLCYSGEEFPLRPPFLTRPLIAQTNVDTTVLTNGYRLRIGNFFTSGINVPPGDNLPLELPFIPSQPTAQVGISYYVGSFEGGNAFLATLTVPGSEYAPTWRDRGDTFYVGKANKREAARYEVWCPESVIFQATNSASDVQR